MALIEVDFSTIAKNGGSVSGTKRQTTGYTLDPLNAYFETDDILVANQNGVNYNLELSSGVYHVATASSEFGIFLPLNDIYKIKKITYDIQMPTSASRYYLGRISLAKCISGQTSHSQTYYGWVEKTGGQYYTGSTPINDNNWHTITYDIPDGFDTNYVGFNTCTYAGNGDWYFKNIKITYEPFYSSNGGGATHIAKVTGQLKDLSSNLSDILIVSGGGGGGLLVGENAYAGADAGGISGSGSNSGNQSTGYAFGQGESGTNVSGGGSGLYGGYKGTSSKSGGAGSGYIGDDRGTKWIGNKKMVGFNVPTSEAEDTKTESLNEVSENPASGKPKSGNGFARIKFLTPVTPIPTSIHSQCAQYLPSSQSGETAITNLPASELVNIKTDKDILTGQSAAKRFIINDNQEISFDSQTPYWSTSQYYVYLGDYYRMYGVHFKYKKPYIYDTSIVNNVFIDMVRLEVENNAVVVKDRRTVFVGDGQAGSGIISDYVDVDLQTMSWKNNSIAYNYICLISMNNRCFIKDLAFDLLPVSV